MLVLLAAGSYTHASPKWVDRQRSSRRSSSVIISCMRALTLIPSHWYSWDFFVTDDGRQLAEFNLSSWREDWPFLLKSFAMRLTIIQWKRGAAAGS